MKKDAEELGDSLSKDEEIKVGEGVEMD